MNCIFCGSSKITDASYPRPTVFNDKKFSYKSCQSCELIFIDPLPAPDDYNKMYAASYHNEFYFNENPPDYSNWNNLLVKFSNEKSILDYGCGDGSFLKFFEKQGFECFGVEYDHQLVERLKKENPRIKFYTVEEFWEDTEARYNAIFMGDVLEHISTPADFLKKLYAKLKTGGLVVAQGPLENDANLALSVRKLISKVKSGTGKTAIASHVPYHIFFSNAKNQKAVFENSGFETKYYHVFETPWPYPDKLSASPLSAFQYFTARSSIILSKIFPGKMGNRFLYIGEKK